MTHHCKPLELGRISEAVPIGVDRLLGAVTYGVGGHAHPACFGSVPLPVLPDGGLAHTAWLASGPFMAGTHDGMHYRCDEHVQFGFISLNEADFPSTDEASAIQQVSQAAYLAIFATIEKAGFNHLVRCWNYIPHINADDKGLERYRHFNIGRQNAFIAAHCSHLAGAPSACALGTKEGALIVYFLASRAQPHTIENPRQLSAYLYPEQYGPRSPNFSRAALLPLPGMEALFISGTASIVGHESVHLDDVKAQTTEALRNIEIVVEQANLKSRLGGFTTRAMNMKVFIRHAADMENVLSALRERLGEGIDTILLQADICRADLLVEIEAFGYSDHEPA